MFSGIIHVFQLIINFCVSPQCEWPKLAVHVQLDCLGVISTLLAPFIAWKTTSILGCRTMNRRDVLNVWNCPRKRNVEPKNSCQEGVWCGKADEDLMNETAD